MSAANVKQMFKFMCSYKRTNRIIIVLTIVNSSVY